MMYEEQPPSFYEKYDPGARLLSLMLEVCDHDMVLATVHLNGLIQGLQIALAHPEWAHAYTTWAEGHVNDSGLAYPKLDPDLARAITDFGRIETSDLEANAKDGIAYG